MAENKVRFLRGTAAEYADAVKDDDTFYYTTDDERFYVGSNEITGGSITVDSNLSDTSTHPVQNKVIKAAIDEKANSSHTHVKTDILDFPESLPANGGNADTVNGHAVEKDVPADAVFTDTIYNLPTAGLNTLGGVTTTSTVSSSSGHTACPIIKGVPYYRNTLPYQGNTDANGEYRLLLSYQTNDNSYQEYYLRKSGKFTANPSTGTLKANSVIVSESTDYTTPKCRNCTMSTSSASGGSNGDIHFQYS